LYFITEVLQEKMRFSFSHPLNHTFNIRSRAVWEALSRHEPNRDSYFLLELSFHVGL